MEVTLGSTARAQGIFPSCGFRLVLSSLPGEMGGGVTAASLQWLIPSSSLQGPEGFRPLKLRPLAWIALIQGCSGNLQKVFFVGEV